MVLQAKLFSAIDPLAHPRRELGCRGTCALVRLFENQELAYACVCNPRYDSFRYRNRLDRPCLVAPFQTLTLCKSLTKWKKRSLEESGRFLMRILGVFYLSRTVFTKNVIFCRKNIF